MDPHSTLSQPGTAVVSSTRYSQCNTLDHHSRSLPKLRPVFAWTETAPTISLQSFPTAASSVKRLPPAIIALTSFILVRHQPAKNKLKNFNLIFPTLFWTGIKLRVVQTGMHKEVKHNSIPSPSPPTPSPHFYSKKKLSIIASPLHPHPPPPPISTA